MVDIASHMAALRLDNVRRLADGCASVLTKSNVCMDESVITALRFNIKCHGLDKAIYAFVNGGSHDVLNLCPLQNTLFSGLVHVLERSPDDGIHVKLSAPLVALALVTASHQALSGLDLWLKVTPTFEGQPPVLKTYYGGVMHAFHACTNYEEFCEVLSNKRHVFIDERLRNTQTFDRIHTWINVPVADMVFKLMQ